MDCLSAAAGVFAVIQMLREVVDVCQKYYFAAKGAGKDIQRLSAEITELVDTLEKIAELATGPEPAKLPLLARLKNPEGVLNQMHGGVEGVVAKLNKGRSRDG